MYFNKRHHRSGPVFQSRYKAIIVDEDNYLLHLSRYIHLNPSSLTQDIANWHSSYADYIGQRSSPWLKPDIVLDFFQSDDNTLYKANTYRDFVKHHQSNPAEILGDLTLT